MSTMTTVALLDTMLAGVTRLATLKAIYDQAAAEGRTDLTEAEVDIIHGQAVQAVGALLGPATPPPGA